MTRVLIIERILLTCEVIAAALDNEPNISETGIAISMEQALQKLRTEEYHLAIISTSLPNGAALDLTQRIAAEYPHIKMIILGVVNSEAVILRFIEAGALGYVFREDSVDALLQNVQAVIEGRALIEPEIAASLIERGASLTHELLEQGANPEQYAELTAREKEVLSLIEQGLTNQEIAETLVIELGTVKNHVHNILNKLNVNSRKDAAAERALIKQKEAESQVDES